MSYIQTEDKDSLFQCVFPFPSFSLYEGQFNCPRESMFKYTGVLHTCESHKNSKTRSFKKLKTVRSLSSFTKRRRGIWKVMTEKRNVIAWPRKGQVHLLVFHVRLLTKLFFLPEIEEKIELYLSKSVGNLMDIEFKPKTIVGYPLSY